MGRVKGRRRVALQRGRPSLKVDKNFIKMTKIKSNSKSAGEKLLQFHLGLISLCSLKSDLPPVYKEEKELFV